jgi:hypothetical protein
MKSRLREHVCREPDYCYCRIDALEPDEREAFEYFGLPVV